ADVLHDSIGLGFDRDHMIDRQQQLHVAFLGISEQVLGEVNLVGFEQRLTNFLPLRLEEGKNHASADDQRIDLGQQVLNDADLVADLGSAQDPDKRLFGIFQRLAEIL